MPRNSSYWTSLRLRMLAPVLLALLPALALLIWSALDARQDAADRVRAETRQLLDRSATDVERALDTTGQFLGTLARLPEVRQKRLQELNHLFAELIAERPSYANLGLTDAQGNIVASGVPLKEPASAADRSWFRWAMDRQMLAVGEYQVGRVTGKPSLNLGYPVRDADGRPFGVVFAAMELDRVNRLPLEGRLPRDSVLAITDRNGTILLRHPDGPEHMGRKLPADVLEVLRTEEQGSRTMAGMDDTERLHVYSRLRPRAAGTSGYISIGVPTSHVYAGANAALLRNLAIVVVVGGLSLALSWWMGDLLVLHRIRALGRAARALGQLDLAARTGVPHSQDELGELAASLDEMAERLEHTTHRHELILGAAGEGICGVDRAGCVVFANPAACEILGCRAEELPGKSLFGYLSDSMDGAALRRTLSEGTRATSVDASVHREDGQAVPVDYTSSPLRAGGAVVVLRDVGDRRRHRHEVEAFQAQLLQAERDKKWFTREVLRAVTGGRFHLVEPFEIPTPGDPIMELDLEKPGAYSEGRQTITRLATAGGLTDDQADELVLAFGEAATNAIKHATGGRVQLFQGDGSMIVRVSDRGTGIKAENLPATLFESGFSTKVSLGMGYTLMLRIADTIWLSTGPGGTVVQIEKCADSGKHQEDSLMALLDRF